MGWYSDWILKAQEHRCSADILFIHGRLRDAITRYYYSAFSLMVAVCGKPPKGRWEHKGILKHFSHWLYMNGNPLTEEELDLLYDFYEKRRMADYTVGLVTKEVVRNYRALLNRMFEVINGWRENDS